MYNKAILKVSSILMVCLYLTAYRKIIPSEGKGITSENNYLCISICLITEAINWYTTFMAAFDRFHNRRNLAHIIHSDNGKTFTDGKREIKGAENSSDFRKIKQFINGKGVSWSFYPPYAIPDRSPLRSLLPFSAEINLNKTFTNKWKMYLAWKITSRPFLKKWY